MMTLRGRTPACALIAGLALAGILFVGAVPPETVAAPGGLTAVDDPGPPPPPDTADPPKPAPPRDVPPPHRRHFDGDPNIGR